MLAIIPAIKRRFGCHQWLPECHVCKRCGATKEEVVRDEWRKQIAKWPDDARRAVDRLTAERDSALSEAATTRQRVFDELIRQVDVQFGRLC